MASIEKRPDGVWRARYYDETSKQHAKHFGRKGRREGVAGRSHSIGRDRDGVTLPRRRRAEASREIPTTQTVGKILAAADSDFVTFVALYAFAGLRLGEAAAVQLGDVDFLRRTLAVSRQVQRVNSGALTCDDAAAYTLKRNSTTSPSPMT